MASIGVKKYGTQSNCMINTEDNTTEVNTNNSFLYKSRFKIIVEYSILF